MLTNNLIVLPIILSFVALCSFQTGARETRPVQREDSVRVSAGISREQRALEDRLDVIILQGDQSLQMDRATDAIKGYQSALDLVQKEPLLAEQRKRVLEKLATGYMVGKRPGDAIPIYSMLLDASKKYCDSESTAVSICAEAQYNLGLARMRADNFADALPSLQEAEASYAKAEKFGSHEFSIIESKDQAQTKLLTAFTLSRLGRTAEAITATEEMISALDRVEADNTIRSGIRNDAKRSRKEAQALLARLKLAH